MSRRRPDRLRAKNDDADDADEADEAEHEPEPRDPAERGEPRATAPRTERAILAAVLGKRDDSRADKGDPLEELAALAKTAGVEVIEERVIQRRDKPDVTTYIGKGTTERLAELVKEQGANVVIFDNDLSPGQRRNLEKVSGTKVIDRTELILDIFVRHARTVQAKLQVELAQLEYSLPRLKRLWTHLDTGVGMRAAGEKQIEVDKRLIRERILEIRRELDQVRARKERQVRGRGAFSVAIVGYTNAGKSTLMNRLTAAGVYVADKLFATLDTRTKGWKVGPNRVVLLSDTVGFVRQLPHHLVESFHATLEEVVSADLLLHIVDASDPDAELQVKAVRDVLESLGAHEKPELLVLNKVDRVAQRELLPWLEHRAARLGPVRISAKTGEGIDQLTSLVNDLAAAREGRHRVVLDVREGAAIAWLEGQAEVLRRDLDDERMTFEVRCTDEALAALRSKARDREALVVETIAPAPPPVSITPRGRADDPAGSAIELDALDDPAPLDAPGDDDRPARERGVTSPLRGIHKHTRRG